MRLIISIIAALAFLPTSMPNSQLRANDILRYVPNEAFGYGEQLKYDIGYKFITAGNAIMQVLPEPIAIDGAECYDIRFEVRSLKSLDWLYRVRDRYRTALDVHGLFPWLFEQKIREGNYKRDFEARLDQRNLIGYTNNGEFEITPFTHDILSAFYHVRAMDLKSMHKGDIIELKNFYKKKTYDLNVKILGRERISVEAGTFDCVVIEPLVVEGGLFKSEGSIIVWLSDDERKIPVRVRTKVVIGAIDAELIAFRGLRGPLAARVEED